MRTLRLAALALIVAAAGCGAATPPAGAAPPTTYATTAATAAGAARAVIAERYGVDDTASSAARVVGKIDWLDDAALWAAQRRIAGTPQSRTTSFQIVASVEPDGAGRVAVRVTGIVAGDAARLPGQGPATIETGDARMPAWADARVDAVRAAIDHRLRPSAIR